MRPRFIAAALHLAVLFVFGVFLGACTRIAAPPLAPHVTPNAIDAGIQAAVNAMPQGAVTIKAPPEMQVGRTDEIDATVYERVRDAVNDQLKSGKVRGLSKPETLRISQSLNAELYHAEDQFRVTPFQKPNEFLAFGPDGRIQWRWEIEPLVAGRDLQLQLVVTAALNGGSGDAPRVHVVTKDITLHIQANVPYSVKQFVYANIQWLTTAIVIPLGVWLFALIRRNAQLGRPSQGRGGS